MNNLFVGTATKPEDYISLAQPRFLVVDSGPVADAFIGAFPQAKLFDLSQHRFNPLKHITVPQARAFADTIYAAYPGGKDTLTVRNGKRALARLARANTTLDQLPDIDHVGNDEAHEIINDLLLSPLLTDVLCGDTNFSFKGQVVAKIDRAELGDLDAFVLGNLLIGQAKGQVIVPEFVFYGRDHHTALITQHRLIAGVSHLSGLSDTLRDEILLIKDKRGRGCTHDDALELAKYAGLIPNTTAHTDFVQDCVRQ